MSSLKAIANTVESQTRILSPAVGFCSLAPNPETYLPIGAFIGKLTILNTNINLYLPTDVFGKTLIEKDRDKIFPVEYKQELFRLIPENIRSNIELKKIQNITKDKNGLEAGFVIRASIAGIFYSRPSPDAPAYVKAGQKITKGKILGLIEVMKTFNHIVFQGMDKSDSGIVKKVLCDDAQEVKMGEALFVLA